ncbi:MAG: ABC transporter permease [Chloroflexota bacterium]|nr:ABC transporter permease [Chloroflexota bacterium]
MTQRTAATSPDPAQESPGFFRHLVARQEFGVFMILVIICAFLAIATDTFWSTRNITTVVLFVSWIAIAAFGETMVILTAGIDLSVGSMMALAGFATAWLLTWPPLAETLPVGLLVLIGVLGGLLAGLVIGVINGGLITRFRLPPFIATLGTMSIARGVTFGGSRGWPIRGLPEEFKQIGQANLSILGLEIPLPIIIMLVLAILTSLFLSKTVTGRHIYAVGGNEEAVRVSGVNPNRIKMLVYIACAMFAALAGLINTAKLGVAAPTAATGWELDIIAAVVIGGTSLFGGEGTILGTLIGALIMGVIRNGLNLLGFPAYWQPAAIGTVIILAVMVDYYRKDRQ